MRLRIQSFSLIILALSSSLLVLNSCKTRHFQISSIRRPDEAAALARWQKAQDSLVPVQETLGGTSSEAQIYQKYLAEYKESYPSQSDAGIKDIRPELVALSREDGLQRGSRPSR